MCRPNGYLLKCRNKYIIITYSFINIRIHCFVFKGRLKYRDFGVSLSMLIILRTWLINHFCRPQLNKTVITVVYEFRPL